MHRSLAPICVVIVSMAAVAGGQDTYESRVAVAPLQGQVAVWRTGAEKVEPLARTERLPREDRLGSRTGAVARIGVEQGIVVTLKGVKPSAEQGLSVETVENKKIVMKLIRGSVVVESAEADISLQTPAGAVRGEGCCFLIEIAGDAVRVVALAGDLTFANDLGSVTIPSGSGNRTGNGQAPGRPEPTVLSQEGSWASEPDAKANLIPNPGFDGSLGSWSTRSMMGKGSVAVDSEVFRNGKASARIRFAGFRLEDKLPGEFTAPLTLLSKGIGLKPNAKYFLRLWARTEKLTADGEPIQATAGLWTGVYPFQKPQSQEETFSVLPAEGRWRCGLFFFTTGATPKDLQFGLPLSVLEWDKAVEGTVWIDDIYLAEVTATPEAGK